MASQRRRIAGVTVLVMTTPMLTNSCANAPDRAARETIRVHADAGGTDLEIAASGVRARFSPRIDRLVFFGPDAPNQAAVNLLHTQDLDRSPAADGGYTFFGGAYSWWAPQNGEKGWIGADGSLKNWPPDPAMDTGPSVLTARSERSITVVGPVQRSGLREDKTFRITGPNTAEFSSTLVNTTDRVITAGTWLNTAVAPPRDGAISVIAFKLWPRRPGSILGPNKVRGAMGTDAEGRFRGALDAPAENGWAALPLTKATWVEGIKVYVDTESAPAEIAVWRDGWWLHRRLTTGDRASTQRLRELGEGPVAAYINPGLGIIEAELVAPIVDIPPGGSTTAVERWTLIPSATPDVGVLPAR